MSWPEAAVAMVGIVAVTAIVLAVVWTLAARRRQAHEAEVARHEAEWDASATALAELKKRLERK